MACHHTLFVLRCEMAHCPSELFQEIALQRCDVSFASTTKLIDQQGCKETNLPFLRWYGLGIGN